MWQVHGQFKVVDGEKRGLVLSVVYADAARVVLAISYPNGRVLRTYMTPREYVAEAGRYDAGEFADHSCPQEHNAAL